MNGMFWMCNSSERVLCRHITGDSRLDREVPVVFCCLSFPLEFVLHVCNIVSADVSDIKFIEDITSVASLTSLRTYSEGYDARACLACSA